MMKRELRGPVATTALAELVMVKRGGAVKVKRSFGWLKVRPSTKPWAALSP